MRNAEICLLPLKTVDRNPFFCYTKFVGAQPYWPSPIIFMLFTVDKRRALLKF